MTNAEKMALLQWMYKAIFSHKNTEMDTVKVPRHPSIVGAPVGTTFSGGLRGFDITLLIDGKTTGIRMLEQNPYKRDAAGNLTKYAAAASQGKKIAWVLVGDWDPNRPRWLINDRYAGSIQEGEWVKSKSQPVQNIKPAQRFTGPQNLPEVPVGTDVPEYVEMAMGAESEGEQDYTLDPDQGEEDDALESIPRE